MRTIKMMRRWKFIAAILVIENSLRCVEKSNRRFLFVIRKTNLTLFLVVNPSPFRLSGATCSYANEAKDSIQSRPCK